MTAQITTRIAASPNRDLVCQQIGTILLEESLEQQALAEAEEEDPDPYRLRVFLNRTNPIGEWLDPPDGGSADAVPIINVSIDRQDFERRMSDVVQTRTGPATFFVDCYGYGKAKETETGHTPADVVAYGQASWASTLAESFLLAAHYVDLGLPDVVSERFETSVERLYLRDADKRPIQNVVCFRVTLSVLFSELSPQVEGHEIEVLNVGVKLASTGELLAEVGFDVTPP